MRICIQNKFFAMCCNNTLYARRLPSQHVASWLAMLHKPASTYCYCICNTCSKLKCVHISSPNPKHRPQRQTLTLSSSFQRTFVSMFMQFHWLVLVQINQPNIMNLHTQPIGHRVSSGLMLSYLDTQNTIFSENFTMQSQ